MSQQITVWPKAEVVRERPRTLHQIVSKDCRTTALKITYELNEHPQNQFFTKTVRRELYKKYSKEEL